MKPKRRIQLSIALLLFCVGGTLAQGSFSTALGPAFPTGPFAREDPWDSQAGRAGRGVGVGVCYHYQIAASALGLFGSADLAVNFSSSSAGDSWETFNPDAQFTFPKVIHLPLSAGLTYILKNDPKFSLYGKSGVVVNWLKYTELVVKQPGYDKYSEKYDPSSALGYVLGVGISGKNIILEARYMNPGKHQIAGTWQEGNDSGDLPQVKKKVEMVFITLGWKLF